MDVSMLASIPEQIKQIVLELNVRKAFGTEPDMFKQARTRL